MSIAITTIASIGSFLMKAWAKIKLALAFLAGMAYQKKRQEDAATEEVDSAEDKRNAVRSESDEALRDRLRGRDRS